MNGPVRRKKVAFTPAPDEGTWSDDIRQEAETKTATDQDAMAALERELELELEQEVRTPKSSKPPLPPSSSHSSRTAATPVFVEGSSFLFERKSEASDFPAEGSRIETEFREDYTQFLAERELRLQLEKELADARSLADKLRSAASHATAQLQEERESRSLLEQDLRDARAELSQLRASSAEQEEREQVELIMERNRGDSLQRQLDELQQRLDTEMQLRFVVFSASLTVSN